MSARKVPTQWDGQQQLELQLPHRVPIDSARVPAHSHTSLASLPPHSGSHARARPLASFVWRAFVVKKSYCTLDCGRKCLVLPCITYDELLGPVLG